MAESKLQYKPVSFGAVGDRSISTLQPGENSVCQNARPMPKGIAKRGGQTRLHTSTVNASNEGRSIYHFQKDDSTPGQVFVQFEDGSVEDCTSIPPAITDDPMGSEVLASKAGAKCGTWADFRDLMFFSDRAHQHQVYAGATTPVIGFIQYRGGEDGNTAPSIIPEAGWDDTVEISDGRNTTYSDVSSMDDVDAHHRLYIVSLTPINQINFEFSSYNGSEVGVATYKFWNGSTFVGVTNQSDGTDGGFVFSQDGAVTFDSPTTEKPGYAFGISGYVYEMSTAAGAMDGEVRVTSVTVENTDGFQDIENLWDGRTITPVLAQVEVGTETLNYASTSVNVGGLVAGKYVYVLSAVPFWGLRINVGNWANTSAVTATTVEVWDGNAFVGTTETDSTNGGKKSDYIAWQRPSRQKKTVRAGLYGYCCRFKFDVTLDAELFWRIEGLPYYDINEHWHIGNACASWKGRMLWAFNDNLIHPSALYQPTALNGLDYRPIAVGDTRKNPILAIVPFYNECLVFQQELGTKGGCTTLLEGDSPSNFSILVMSHKIGIMNGNCHVTLEDADVTDLGNLRSVFKCVVWLSREGLYKTDGTVLANISDAAGISHYFEGDDLSVKIRKDYEHKHYVKWDSKYQGVNIGLVTGTTATEPNVFLFYDPSTGKIGTDIRGQVMTTVGECASGSGNEMLTQLGMADDGFLYRLNDGWDDVGASTVDVTLKLRTEFSGGGNKIKLRDETIRASVESGIEVITRNLYLEGRAVAENSTEIPLVNADLNTLSRKRSSNVGDAAQISIEYVHTETGAGVEIYDQAYEVEVIAGGS